MEDWNCVYRRFASPVDDKPFLFGRHFIEIKYQCKSSMVRRGNVGLVDGGASDKMWCRRALDTARRREQCAGSVSLDELDAAQHLLESDYLLPSLQHRVALKSQDRSDTTNSR